MGPVLFAWALCWLDGSLSTLEVTRCMCDTLPRLTLRCVYNACAAVSVAVHTSSGWLWKLLEKGAVDTLIPTLKSKPHILSMKNVKVWSSFALRCPRSRTPLLLQGYTLMHTAACNNNLAFVQRCWTERLLSPQLVNATDLAGNTPLHLAVVKGHEHMVR